MTPIRNLANPQLRDIAVYEPGKPIEETARELGTEPDAIIKLASNENPLGPSPKAIAAMRAALDNAHLYPDGSGFYLCKAVAARLGLAPENVILGNGSNEVIEFLGHAFLNPGDDVITFQYAFIVYKLLATSFAARTIELPTPNFQQDLGAMLDAITPKTRLIFIPNPNNPTGILISQRAIDSFMSRVPKNIVVVFDEAYFEFLDDPPDTLQYVREGRNVVVLRTFSKIHGLAGLRIGYGVAAPDLIEVLHKTRQPFNVNSIAQAGALAALEDDAHLRETKRLIDEGRAYLQEQFSEMRIPFVPAVANFVMVNVGNSCAVFEKLLRRKIIVRPLKGYGLPEWVRITVGTMEENKKLIAALREVMKSEVRLPACRIWQPHRLPYSFGSRIMTVSDTIAAISTPPGEGAIAMVRVSGANAIQIADKIFRGKEEPSRFVSHVQHLGEIFSAENELIDRAVVSVHRAPGSYTGEDLVEISCHGGTLVSAKVLEACLRAGARPARPGEFTERAFLHGKMDLTQAEAVIDLIRARTDLALRSATEQLEGRLGDQIRRIRDKLIALLAHINASVDFPEEGIVPDEGEMLCARLDAVREEIAALLATADQGRVLREGVRVVIYGATNAGKSSLLNRLLGYDRVIVSDIHGTTRDTIEETVNLDGVPLRLLDTAGLRPSEDELESEGIARTEKSLQLADLRLHIADRNAPCPAHFNGRPADANEIVVLNKSDLPEDNEWKNFTAFRISCLTGEGLPQLQKEILSRIGRQNLRPESAMAINTRHRDCLRRALESCDRARSALGQGISQEYVAVDLDQALRTVGEVIGEVDVEQILDSVFSQFCIGK